MKPHTLKFGDKIKLKAVEVIRAHDDYITVRLFSTTAARVEYCDIEDVIPRPLAPGDCVLANLEIVSIDGDTAWCRGAPCPPEPCKPEPCHAPPQCHAPPPCSSPCYPIPVCNLTRSAP